MFKKLRHITENTLNKKIDPTGLAVFRIVFSLILFFSVFQLSAFRHFIYDEVPFVKPAPTIHSLIFVIWLLIILLITLGIYTRLSAIANYIFTICILSSLDESFKYHIIYLITSCSFLFIFLPVSNALSVDSWRKNRSGNYDGRISVMYYYMLLFIIGLMYFDSTFYKLDSEMWRRGLGIWLPASLPQYNYLNTSFLLDQEWIVKTLSYSCWLFEAIFIFLFWFKRFRFFLFFMGIMIHVGIIIFLPIPLFGLGALSFYVLLVPVGFWRQVKISSYRSTLIESKKASSDFNVTFIIFFFVACVFFQLSALYNCRVICRMRRDISFYGTKLDEFIEAKMFKCSNFSKTYFGITQHTVFTDTHLIGSKEIYAVAYINDRQEEIFLPMVDENANPRKYDFDFMWVNWTFRVNGAFSNDINLKKGLERYTAFWLGENKLNYDSQTFVMYKRKVEVPFYWKEGLLNSQKQFKWEMAGNIFWNNNECNVKLIE